MLKINAVFLPFFKVLLVMLLLAAGGDVVKGQTRNYATVSPSNGLVSYDMLLGNQTGSNADPGSAAGSVANPNNVIIPNNTSFTTLSSKYFSLLIGGTEGESWLQIKYPTTISTGTTYIRFDEPTFTGLNLNLLQIIGNLTGLLKKNLVQLDVYTGATSTNNGTLVNATNISSSVVRDALGANYFAVTSTTPYNSIRIRLRFRGDLLGLNAGAINMKIYNAFYTTKEDCSPSRFATIGESTGVNITLTELIKTPEKAIDNDIATSSQLQAGVVGLNSTISQTIFLNGLSTSDDYVKVYLSVPASILTLDLFNNITIQAYNGNTAIGSPQSINSLLLNLDLLGLFSNDQITPVFFKPGLPFDRVKITMAQVVAAGGNILSGGLNIHEVQLTPPKPTFTIPPNSQDVTICSGNTAVLNAMAGSGNELIWYDSLISTTALVKNSDGSFTTPALTENTTYYVASRKSGCTYESARVPVNIIINPRPSIILGPNPATCVETSTVELPYTSPTNSPITYSILWSNIANTNGFVNITDALLPTTSIPISIPNMATAGTYNGTLYVKNVNGCISTGTSFSVILYPSPFTPSIIPLTIH